MNLRHTLVIGSLRVLVDLVFRVHDDALKQVPMQGPLILVCNHVHIWEIPANYTHLMPRRTIGMVLAKRWENPFFRYIVETVDAIPVKRDELDMNAIRKALQRLQEGRIVAIDPEGTRSGTGILGEGHPGAVLLATKSGAPLLPVVHYGSENYRETMRRIRRTDMNYVVGKPFRVRTDLPINHETRQMVTDEIMAQMAALLPEKYRGRYGALVGKEPKYLSFKDMEKWKNIKNDANAYASHLDNLKPKPMDASTYSELIGRYIVRLNRCSIDFCVATILASLEKWINAVRANKDKYSEEYTKSVNPDPYLSDLEWAIDTTVKKRNYQRHDQLHNYSADINQDDLAKEISSVALSQKTYDDMINFFGELAGSWILTYPIEATKKYDLVTFPDEWATEEIDYIYILRRYFDVNFEEWRR
jgi:1-acyl-sn-glycerol-3-phosphate acyltransferase